RGYLEQRADKSPPAAHAARILGQSHALLGLPSLRTITLGSMPPCAVAENGCRLAATALPITCGERHAVVVSASPDGGSNRMSTSVFFIGGYAARPEHVDRWVKNAQKLKSSVAFRGFAWPVTSKGKDVTSYPADDVVKGWKDTKQYQPVVDAVK